MKNLMIYMHPSKAFTREAEVEMRVQIDNSLEWWKIEDIILITNFSYAYNGVKAIQMEENHFYVMKPRSTNTIIIPYLCDIGLIENGELYWLHDIDAFQMQPIKSEEINLNGVDVGFTTYGWSPKWCLGSIFLKKSSADIFTMMRDNIYQNMEEDERVMVRLTKTGTVPVNRYKIMNITYNFGMRQVGYNYSIADKPIKVAHFHPFNTSRGVNTKEVFLEGKNELGFPLITSKLAAIFREHGVG